MCWRFRTGSNRPLANREARMLSTHSLPRKWSIRKTCDSSKIACTVLFSAWAEARSVPNGFPMMTREPGAALGSEHGHRGLEGRRRDGEMEEPPGRAADRPLGLLDGRGQRCGAGGFRGGERERLLE